MRPIFAFCLCAFIWINPLLNAQEPPSQLTLNLIPFATDEGRPEPTENRLYYARIINATNDPKLPGFVSRLNLFKLRSLGIERTTLTSDQAHQLERVVTETLTISNCLITEEVAKSLGKIQCHSLILDKMQMSDRSLSALLDGKEILTVHAKEIRGCTAEGWRGLANKTLELNVSDCDFDDQALLHLSSSKCSSLQIKNAQLKGATFGSLKSQKELAKLALCDCPVNEQLLQALPKFSKLHELDLSGTPVTDDWFRNFVVSPSLKSVKLARTKVTSACAMEITRRHQENESEPLMVWFTNDPRWPPQGGVCTRGEFHLHK